MRSVVETNAYLRQAEDAGLSEAERVEAVAIVAANPTAGVVIPGSGGCRKIRTAGRGKGKSGGYRIVLWFGGGERPVYLLALLSKGDRANFNHAELNAMKAYVANI